jgi:hypothetical protein
MNRALNLQLAETQQRRAGTRSDELQKQAALLRGELPQNFKQLDDGGMRSRALLEFCVGCKVIRVPIPAILPRNDRLSAQHENNGETARAACAITCISSGLKMRNISFGTT